MHAEKFNGKYIQRKVRYENQNKFKCEIDHTIILTNQELKQKKWCTKCEKLWDETTVYARRHKIKVTFLVQNRKI